MDWIRKLLCFLIGLLILSISIYEIVWNVEENRCGMTWMYEYPEYIKVHLPPHVESKFDKYSLYIYGEGTYADLLKSMRGNYRLSGIPVVFVHGNGGRYKQVRSPGSVSLRKSEKSYHHFNYFSVDYEEELSALYGPYLQRQTEYLSHCITAILSCYSHLKNKPTSVIAIGHSMGGLVIRGLFTLPHFDSSLVSTVINLATPQTQPVATLDSFLYNYYHAVNSFWSLNGDSILQNVTFISIAGGLRDYQVRSDLCTLDRILNRAYHFSASTTGIPLVWRSTDHQCIVWCNELVRLITRSFFRMIVQSTGQITSDPNWRRKIVSELYLGDAVSISSIEVPSGCKEITADKNIAFYRRGDTTCFYLHSNEKILEEGYTMMNIWVQRHVVDWLYLCGKSDNCSPLHNVSQVLPGKDIPTTFARMKILRPDQFILLRFNDAVEFYTQQVNHPSLKLDLPYILSRSVDISVTNRFYVDINIPSFAEFWQVYEMVIDSYHGQHVVANMHVPWSNEDKYFLIDPDSAVFQLSIFQEKPDVNSGSLKLKIWGKDLELLKIKVKAKVFNSLGQLFRFNIENIIRNTLLFGMIRVFFHFSIKEVSSKVSLRIFHNKMLIGSVILVLLKIILSFKCQELFDVLLLKRKVYQRSNVIIMSFLMSTIVDIVMKMFIVACTYLLLPVIRMSKLVPLPSLSSRFKKVIAIPLALTCFIKYANVGIFSFTLIFVHLYKIAKVFPLGTRRVHIEVFVAIVPVIVAFCTSPFVVYVKNTINGFSMNRVDFLNLQVLGGSYLLYLLTDFSSYCRTSSDLFIMKLRCYLRCSVALVVLVFILDIFPLYTVTYFASYILLIIMLVF